MAKKQPEKVYQFHISMKYLEPKIWRRFLVTEETSLEKLHKIIQEVMGWDDFHMHEFTIERRRFGTANSEWDFDEVLNEKKFKISDLKLTEKSKFSYLYDFGDGWEHEIKVEKILPFENTAKYPKCIAGKMACPPEDCGSYSGYDELRDLSKLSKDELDEYQLERLEWLDEYNEDYDFEFYNVDDVNAVLWKRFAKKIKSS